MIVPPPPEPEPPPPEPLGLPDPEPPPDPPELAGGEETGGDVLGGVVAAGGVVVGATAGVVGTTAGVGGATAVLRWGAAGFWRSAGKSAGPGGEATAGAEDGGIWSAVGIGKLLPALGALSLPTTSAAANRTTTKPRRRARRVGEGRASGTSCEVFVSRAPSSGSAS